MAEAKLYAVLDEKGEQVVGARAFATDVPPHKREILRLRPLDDPGAPALEWWQQLAGHDFQIGPDLVTKVYRVEARPLDELKRIRKREVDQQLLGDLGVETLADVLRVVLKAASAGNAAVERADAHRGAIDALPDATSIVAYDIKSARLRG